MVSVFITALTDTLIIERIIAEIRLVEDRLIQINPRDIAIYRHNRVVQLNLSSIGISHLPNVVSKLQSLESLYLGNNLLMELPKDIGKLSNLKRLAAWDNKLNSIPESIGLLQNLLILDLGYNSIKQLPTSIGSLLNLRKMNIEGNRLVDLPNTIQYLKKLEVLHIYSNPMKYQNPPLFDLINKLESQGIKVHTHLRNQN